jgi:hypothetical protein
VHVRKMRAQLLINVDESNESIEKSKKNPKQK